MKARNRVAVSIFLMGLITAAASGQQTQSTRRANQYGTAGDSLYRIGPLEFMPLDNNAQFFDYFEGTTMTLSRALLGSPLVGMPHLPSGALVTGVEFDFCDNTTFFDLTMTAYTAASDGTGTTAIGSVTSNGASSGCGSNFVDLSSQNFTLDNGLNEIFFVVSSPDVGGETTVSGAIVHYRLQVSPAPLTPTFDDVPTSDFGFQFVEAFAAAGITVGCTETSYCPDRTVTRREMAIFFAKALGLQFP